MLMKMYSNSGPCARLLSDALQIDIFYSPALLVFVSSERTRVACRPYYALFNTDTVRQHPKSPP